MFSISCLHCGQNIPGASAMLDLHLQNECELNWNNEIIINDLGLPNVKMECDFIKEIMREDKMKRGNTYYLISFKWWQLWCEYVGYTIDKNDNNYTSTDKIGLCRPSPIDNSMLMNHSCNTLVLREDLQRGHDYEILPRKAWINLVHWYGGGPEIPKKVILQSALDASNLGVVIYPINVLVDFRSSLTPNQVKYSFSRYQTLIDIKYIITNDFYMRPHECVFYVVNLSGKKIKMKKEHNNKTLAELNIRNGFSFILSKENDTYIHIYSGPPMRTQFHTQPMQAPM